MNTQELMEALLAQADFIDADTYDECWEVKETPRGKMLRAAASRLSEMDAEIKRLREALREIAKQVPAKDMDEDYYEAADFEDGYDRCVFAARAALEHQP